MSTGSRPSRSLANAPTTAGASAISSRAWSGVGGHAIRRSAPKAEKPVRSASRGAHEVGSARSAPSTVGVRLDRRQHLVRRRPVAVEQQPDDSVVAAVLGEIADLVAAVEQPPRLSVDQRDRGLGGNHALETAADLYRHRASIVSRAAEPTVPTRPAVRQYEL